MVIKVIEKDSYCSRQELASLSGPFNWLYQ